MTTRATTPQLPGVIVTGGAKRIGASICRALAKDGRHVIIHYQTSLAEAEALAADIQGGGGRCTIAQADLSVPSERKRLIEQAFGACSSLNALINCASAFSYDTWEFANAQSIAHAMNVNAIAPLELTQEFVARLSPNAEACIVNFLDNKVLALNPDYFSYTVSKVALSGITEMLSQALPPNIRICAIAPGITLVSGNQTHENFIAARTRNPLKQGCTPDQIVSAARYCLETRSYSGQTMTIDGGEFLQPHGRDVAFLDPA